MKESIEPVYTMVRAGGKPAILLNIARQPTAIPSKWLTWYPQKSSGSRPLLPPGVTSRRYYDQSELVRDSISSVRDAILIGLILATIIIVIFLRDWRSSAGRWPGDPESRSRSHLVCSCTYWVRASTS